MKARSDDTHKSSTKLSHAIIHSYAKCKRDAEQDIHVE